MALISAKGIYGLGAMYELSKYELGTKVKASDIASLANVPLGYLEQILGKLRKAGFIESIRGAGGGYVLSRKPEDIKVSDVLAILEDSIKIVDECNNDILNIFFDDIKSELVQSLSISLSDMCKYKDKYNSTLYYDI